jgi:hypothetical protein
MTAQFDRAEDREVPSVRVRAEPAGWYVERLLDGSGQPRWEPRLKPPAPAFPCWARRPRVDRVEELHLSHSRVRHVTATKTVAASCAVRLAPLESRATKILDCRGFFSDPAVVCSLHIATDFFLRYWMISSYAVRLLDLEFDARGASGE